MGGLYIPILLAFIFLLQMNFVATIVGCRSRSTRITILSILKLGSAHYGIYVAGTLVKSRVYVKSYLQHGINQDSWHISRVALLHPLAKIIALSAYA